MARPRFIDQARIFVRAGDGGDGHASFRREKFVPKGGPDGGDGGRGGDVLLVGSQHRTTLEDFQFLRHFRADDGAPGGRSQKAGKDGKDLRIPIPLGTVIFSDDREETLGEVISDGEEKRIEAGGKGGKGNIHFKTSTNRAPRKFTPGVKREGRWIRLELRLLADIGIVGLPNAGKSTLLAALTRARPKVAPYPFTTLHPILGVLRYRDREMTLADIPGLIEGAHEGAGLGIQFLNHVRRTKLLLFLVAADADPKVTWKDVETTSEEIRRFDETLAQRPRRVILNKNDLLSEHEIRANLDYFRKRHVEALAISAKEKTGLDSLRELLFAPD